MEKTPIPLLHAPYTPPFGLPLYWRHEESGRLRWAVESFLLAAADGTEMALRSDFDMVRAYCIYWIEAPAWKFEAKDRTKAKNSIQAAETTEALSRAITSLLDLGLDPI